ncbi:MAG TPA: Mth938-like domain-containing protein [Magnetospirillum sp.]|nr:Mth938-like domain-containing protein [Magnetospirillum sp.]
MDITPVVSADRQLISGYGDLGFTISGIRHEGSVLVLPTRTLPWAVTAMAELTVESLAPILTAEPRPAVLMLGCGKGMSLVPRDIKAALRAAGIVVEPMDTGAACRTYNVLLTEGRDVAAALIAV